MTDKKYKSAVCCEISYYTPYIREWIAHHYVVGFDMVICIIRDVPGRPIDRILSDIQSMPNHILDKMGTKIFAHDPKPNINQSALARQEIITDWQDQIEWLADWSVDELFCDISGHTINQLLDTIPGTCDHVFVPWVVYGACDRFLSLSYPETRHTGFRLSSGTIRPTWHLGYGQPIRRIGSSRDTIRTFCGQTIVPNAEYERPEVTFLANYHTGSIEDYINKAKYEINEWGKPEYCMGGFRDHNRFEERDDRMTTYHKAVEAILKQCRK
jgi:hypothetical protein